MSLKFGTSGLRGLVTELTDLECYIFTLAYSKYLKRKSSTKTIVLGGDYRSSTPRILKAVVYALIENGYKIDFCGCIPTPVLCFYAIQQNFAGIMVTGSHIPDDRNGLKLYMPWGEILKDDEKEIYQIYNEIKLLKHRETRNLSNPFNDDGMFKSRISVDLGQVNNQASLSYIERYNNFFPPDCLKGLKIVIYEHSAVGRDLFANIFGLLDAEVITVGRSNKFLPVDTEAIDKPQKLANWVKKYKANALVSTDGDSDRPLLVDEKGKVIRGDVLGILAAEFLKAESVSVPISCNTSLELSKRFLSVNRTRIGSPFVISSMQNAIKSGFKRVVGYEANGGFLTGSDFINPDTNNSLKALPTRDAMLPILTTLMLSIQKQTTLSSLVEEFQKRYTYSGLLRNVSPNIGKTIIEQFRVQGENLVNKFFNKNFGPARSIDFTDGVRILFQSEEIIHLRQSGNAPEFRCYTESNTEEKAIEDNDLALSIVSETLKPQILKNQFN